LFNQGPGAYLRSPIFVFPGHCGFLSNSSVLFCFNKPTLRNRDSSASKEARTSEENNFSEPLAPNLFELMHELKSREAQFQKTAGFVFKSASGASEKAFPGFFGNVFGCSNPSKERSFSTHEFTRFLSTVSSQRRATRSDVSFQTK